MLEPVMFFSEGSFYREFDTGLFDPAGRGREPNEHRSPFEIDRDRIVHSGAFRRLQGKTQVLLAGEYDFYRTRLTHSIEVAQIGRAICTRLNRTSDHLSLADRHVISSALVEAACLAHDLGHPPFGHAGERTLNALFGPYGGFEGNAQTLRILTRTLFDSPRGPRGMRPTRALVDAVLKYKVTHDRSAKKKNHFVYDEQAEELRFVFHGRIDHVLTRSEAVLNVFRSVECQIMNWADDIAYSVHDVADGIQGGFITRDRVERFAADEALSTADAIFVEELLEEMTQDRSDRFLAIRIGKFIQSCHLVIDDANPMSDLTNRYRFRLVVDAEARAQYEVLGRLARDLMFAQPQITQLEKKGDVMLRRIFDLLDETYGLSQANDAPAPLLPRDVHRSIIAAPSVRAKTTVVRDYLAGMTDAYAIRFYRRLFDPTFGSLTDLV